MPCCPHHWLHTSLLYGCKAFVIINPRARAPRAGCQTPGPKAEPPVNHRLWGSGSPCSKKGLLSWACCRLHSGAWDNKESSFSYLFGFSILSNEQASLDIILRSVFY